MKDGFIWKGIHSNEKKFKIISLPSISTFEKREDKIIVPGRNGYLINTDNTYEGEVKSVEYDYFDDKFDDIKKWLTGSGEVIFSNEPDKYYKARIINKITLDQVLKKFHSGVVQFECQPFGYFIDGKDSLELEKPTSLHNPGTIYSEPTLTIWGTGDITLEINTETIKLTGVNEYITLNSELELCHKEKIHNQGFRMYGEFPRFEVGENKISWKGNVSKVLVEPKWRCL